MSGFGWTRATVALIILTMSVPVGVVPASVGIASAAIHFTDSGPFHPMLTVRAGYQPNAVVCLPTQLCPSFVRSAYGFSKLVGNATTNGTGQAVVIVDACGDPNIVSDVKTFDTQFHLPPANLTVYKPSGTVCSNLGWALETALDVEWAHAIAPGAAVHLIEASSPNNGPLYGAWNYSLVHHLGLAISNSWGGSSPCPSQAASLLSKAAAANTTILASAGDSGGWGSGSTLAAQSPADCKVIVAVGGTTLRVSTTGAYKAEYGWNSSGGGYAPGTTEPTYEVNAKIHAKYSELAKPDVAAIADPNTGVLVYDTGYGGWVVVGGTSVACPIWAGYLTDINSWRAANHFGGLGSLDPYLFASVSGVNGTSPHYAAMFHDITIGNNTFPAGVGWDAVTGLGSFIGYPLAKQLANDRKA